MTPWLTSEKAIGASLGVAALAGTLCYGEPDPVVQAVTLAVALSGWLWAATLVGLRWSPATSAKSRGQGQPSDARWPAVRADESAAKRTGLSFWAQGFSGSHGRSDCRSPSPR